MYIYKKATPMLTIQRHIQSPVKHLKCVFKESPS